MGVNFAIKRPTLTWRDCEGRIQRSTQRRRDVVYADYEDVIPEESTIHSTSATEEALIEHARTQIAGYKLPRSIEFYPEALPKSGAGKILKRDLRDKYWVGKSRNVN
jgi:acyl-CoA synthetase (AMP-forming)/AMP-acid ligase II